MTTKTCLAVLGTMLLATACGKRVPGPPAGAVSGMPRIGWVIMTGDRDNPDQDFVCQSEPRTDCVMPASGPGRQVFTDVHFYFHPAATDTKYTGKIQIGFVEGSAPYELTPNMTVKRGDSLGNTSVIGIVSSKPGTHEMTIAMVAEADSTRQIRDQVRVQVK